MTALGPECSVRGVTHARRCEKLGVGSCSLVSRRPSLGTYKRAKLHSPTQVCSRPKKSMSAAYASRAGELGCSLTQHKQQELTFVSRHQHLGAPEMWLIGHTRHSHDTIISDRGK